MGRQPTRTSPDRVTSEVTKRSLTLVSRERLAGRTVFLAFDADMAGRIAEARWREALLPESAVVTVPLPDGEDVLSCGIPILDLMEASV